MTRMIATALALAGAMLVVGAAQADQFWYYCEDSHSYYPYANTCGSPWRKMPATQQPQATSQSLSSPSSQCLSSSKCIEEFGARAREERAREEQRHQDRAAADRLAQEQAQQQREAAATRQREDTAREAQMLAEDRAVKEAATEKRRQVARTAALKEQEARDEGDGYKRSTVADVILDYSEMSESDKVIVTGHYISLGQVAFLSQHEMDTHSLGISTDGLSRDARKALLGCNGCILTVWARRGCVLTVLNQQSAAPCLVADRIKMGAYGEAGQIRE